VPTAAEQGIPGFNNVLWLGVLAPAETPAGIVNKLTSGVGGLLKNHKVDVHMGDAKFVAKDKVEVTSKDGKKTLEAKNIVVAVGSTPIEVPGFAFDGDSVWSSTHALAPKQLPKRMIVIGGGYIGLELGLEDGAVVLLALLGRVEHDHDEVAALGHADDLAAAALALRRALDDAGQVEQLDLRAAVQDVARDARERRELVRRGARLGARQLGQQRALARRREADERAARVAGLAHVEADALALARRAALQQLRA